MDDGVTGARVVQTRATVRREIAVQCVVTEQDGYQLVGQRVLDLSPGGMRVRSRIAVRPGQRVRVTFRSPGARGRWMQAEGEIVRVERGRRCTDAGYAAGVRFTELPAADREALARELEGLPPIIPRRPMRVPTSRDATS